MSTPGVARDGRLRRYPPLASVVVALMLAAFALPSALNLPQANPGQTLEYAPVPGDAAQAEPGAFAGLGLGSGGNAAGLGDLMATALGPLGLPPGQGRHPAGKRCVGSPPRQTEDPLSPPCVGFFEGGNGGATYAGVTGSTIRTLVIIDSGTQIRSSQGTEQTPAPGYYDLDKPAQGTEHVALRGLRVWQQYFNARYQTYGRRVAFTVYVAPAPATGQSISSTDRKASAQDNWQQVHPFAVLSYLPGGGVNDYQSALAQRGVVNFGGDAGNQLSLGSRFGRYPSLMWAYQPAIEMYSQLYTSFVCRKALPFATSFSGNPGQNGARRRFGIVYTDDPAYPDFGAYGRLAKQQLEACGIDFGGDVGVLPYNTSSGFQPKDDATATTALAQFKRDGVTTVLWAGGTIYDLSTAAANLSYFPEWLLAGDTEQEGDVSGQTNNQTEWQNAWVITPQVQFGRDGVEPPCADAIREAAPSTPQLDYGWYCLMYDDLRQYFTGVQVAGPRINPPSLDEGFRAIPPHPSGTPLVPACFYPAGDYTCVKDGVAEYWNPNGGGGPGSQSAGCWMMVEGGQRHFPGQWPAGEVRAQQGINDVCNTYFTGYNF